MSILNEEKIKEIVNLSATKWLESKRNDINGNFNSIEKMAEEIRYRLREVENKIQFGLEEDFEKKKDRIEKKLNRYFLGITALTVSLILGISGTILFDTISKTQESTIQLYDKLEKFNEKVEESKLKLQVSINNIESKSKELDSLNKEYKAKTNQLNSIIRIVSLQVSKIKLDERRNSNNP